MICSLEDIGNNFFITKSGKIICSEILCKDSDYTIEFTGINFNNIQKILYDLTDWTDKNTLTQLAFRLIVEDSIEIAQFLKKNIRVYFVKSLILFLESFTHFDPLFSERLNDLTRYYFCLFKEEKISMDANLFDKELIYACKKYLLLCLDDKNDDWFEKLNRELEKHITREGQIEKIVETIQSIENQSNKDIEYILKKARTWLLSHYDLRKAVNIQFGKKGLQKYLFFWFPEVLTLLLIVSFKFIKVDFVYKIMQAVIPYLNISIAMTVLYIIMIICSIYLISKIKPGKNQFQILLPRLFAGIIVGYFVLMTDEAWGGVFSKYVRFTVPNENFSHLVFWGKILVPIIFVYIYLLIEMSNVKGIEHIRSKALHIFLRGYTYSFFIGIFFSDLLGENLVKRVWLNNEFNYKSYEGLIGEIYPEPIILLAPLALFIGVFLQLLWEDKAITEKL